MRKSIVSSAWCWRRESSVRCIAAVSVVKRSATSFRTVHICNALRATQTYGRNDKRDAEFASLLSLRPNVKLPPGAGEGNRTPDLLITNQLLYRLSHASIFLTCLFIIPNTFCLVKEYLQLFQLKSANVEFIILCEGKPSHIFLFCVCFVTMCGVPSTLFLPMSFYSSKVLLIVSSALADVWESCVGQCRRFDSDLFHYCRIGKSIYFYGV